MNFNYFSGRRKEIYIPHNTQVPVIASFDCQGNCRPLYFGIVGEDGEKVNISIDKVEVARPFMDYGIKYICLITVQDKQVYTQLFYNTREQKWYIRDSDT